MTQVLEAFLGQAVPRVGDGRRSAHWKVLSYILLLLSTANAAPPPEKITIAPSAGFINGPGNLHSFIVIGHYQDGSERDLTREAVYSMSESGVATPVDKGIFRATSEGVVKVTATVASRTADSAIIVTPATKKGWDFASDIAPIFSKLGCNGSNCHGALNGQSGFKLSLFGYDPEADFRAVTELSNGRRIDRTVPEKSLILQKPIFAVPHGGGKPMETDSLEYATLLNWVREGAPKGKAAGRRLLSLEVFPKTFPVLHSPSEQQQLLVVGYYSDGSRADLSRIVRYTPGDDHVLSVSPTGLVTGRTSGETTILVRTLGQVTAARIGVAFNGAGQNVAAVPQQNFVDELVLRKLQKMRTPPSSLASDAQFVRRVYLDLIGTLPSPVEARDFLANSRPDKRQQLINSLLDRPEYSRFWAQKWGDLFMMAPLYVHDNSLYSHEYFRRNFDSDKPYNEVAKELITGIGTMAEVGPNNFYTRENRRSHEEYATYLTQTLLGVSLECARCHDHPREKWTRDDFLGIAAFFSQVKIKESVGYRPFEGFVTLNYSAEFKHPQTLQIVRPRLLDGSEPAIPPMTDRRALLAEWVASGDNPFFARATVNRIWGQLMGRGLVEPVDDFRATNPASNPELLDRLAAYFVDQGFQLKPLIRLIAGSGTYQLAAGINDSNARDYTNYSHYYMRRLTAEQLLDAVTAVTGVPEKFRGFYLGKRAIDLPDSGVPSYFLDTFDRPIRDVAQCERKTTTTVTQAMHFLGGDTLNKKISESRGTLQQLIAAGKNNREIVEYFYLAALSRSPSTVELESVLSMVSRSAKREQALQSFLWAMLNSKEFLFNH